MCPEQAFRPVDRAAGVLLVAVESDTDAKWGQDMRFHHWAGIALIAALPAQALAQADWPSRAVKIIAPIPAGSSADLLARIYGRELQDKYKQPFVVENHVGASHNIGADIVARAAPDGYTLLTAPPPSLAINKYLFPKLSYDPEAFVAVTVMVDVPNILVLRPGLDFKDVPGLIAYAKANPGKLSYGSTGIGSTLHLSAEAFKAKAGVDLLHVPFTGVTQLISEMIGGRVDVAFAALIDLYPYISAGNVKPLAVGTQKRSPEFPDVPTIGETLPGYVSSAWFAVAAPPKTPLPLAEKISADIRAAFQQPEAQQAVKNLHAVPILDTAAEAADYIRKDSQRWKEVIQANHIQSE